MFHGVRYSLLYRGVYSALKNKKIGKFCSPGPLIYSFFAIFQATIIPFNCKILPLLYRKVKRKYDEEMPRALDYILAKAGVNNFPTILKKNTLKIRDYLGWHIVKVFMLNSAQTEYISLHFTTNYWLLRPKGQLGDWFVLYQLSKNCNPYFFREFIKELSRDLKAKPKKSRSDASSSE